MIIITSPIITYVFIFVNKMYVQFCISIFSVRVAAQPEPVLQPPRSGRHLHSVLKRFIELQRAFIANLLRNLINRQIGVDQQLFGPYPFDN